ncbi:MAG TPA: 3-hydroxyacyl-CoA dehydrogenase NAD-binding domain-containing protein [Candidatus Acidoferrales bacterium]|nr:3-hydroxyacyl-CoA dehydrogenase NAD-binding domain-containing protein [Candidatus Acidoferrales bacterium]
MREMTATAVVGAGVMGSAIAAHLANAGFPVVLLDIVPAGATDRNILARRAIERLLKSDPPAFMHRKAASLIRPGNIADNIGSLRESDWIVEAVVEDSAIKRALYRKIEAVRKDDSVVTSNTSTLRLAELTEGLPERFCRDFLVAHFFNPPRYVRVVELVPGPATRGEALATIREVADRRLGKCPLLCRDTPGFIANRIGAFWLKSALARALEQGIGVEEADAVMSACLGIPRTGVFGLMDLIGLDLVLKVDENLARSLPPEDPYRQIRGGLTLVREMVARGLTGRKGKGGFYRLRADAGATVKEALELGTGSYRPAAGAASEDALRSSSVARNWLGAEPDRLGRYARAVLLPLFFYTAKIAPEIASDVWTIDRALELGYGWRRGPFALMDECGVGAVAELLGREQKEVPPLMERALSAGGFYRATVDRRQYLDVRGNYIDLKREPGIYLLSDLKLRSRRVAGNAAASLWDIADGVACLEIHTKMNTIDADVLLMIRKALEAVRSSFRALVIYNEGEHFSAGVNLSLVLFATHVAAWAKIEELLAMGQQAYQALKYSPFPVVAASFGYALGGGCELMLHADAVQAHAESYIGLVETSVGLVPGWGGCKEMLARLSTAPDLPRGPMAGVAAAFETIGMAKTASSAFEAKELGFLRPSDRITFNRERLLADAKSRALELAENYRPPEPAKLIVPGPSGKAALLIMARELRAAGKLSAHDELVATLLAEVLSGGPDADPSAPVSEEDILRLEREAVLRLLKTEQTAARMEHMLKTGRPLRN